MTIHASALGFPRIGADRELKKAVEGFWSGKVEAAKLQAVCADIRQLNWRTMKPLDSVPVNDFTMYDHVLDTIVMLGAVPERYKAVADPLQRYFAMARGTQNQGADLTALEMTKWFDTNYHYIVPEIAKGQAFKLDTTKIFQEIDEAKAAGFIARPVILGPVSFLLLAKSPTEGHSPIEELDKLLPCYVELFAALQKRGLEWLQLDEPCLVLDHKDDVRKAYTHAFTALQGKARPKVLLTTYFGSLGDNAGVALKSGFDALHLDLCRAPDQLKDILPRMPKDMALSLGLIDGRNIWRADMDASMQVIEEATRALGESRIMVSSSCSLLHVPVDTRRESKLSSDQRSWLAFAAQKVEELQNLAKPQSAFFAATREARKNHAKHAHRELVRERMQQVRPEMARRHSPYAQRATKQRARFQLPAFATTTIGSFPQTAEVRAARAAWRKGTWKDDRYETFLREETQRCVQRQEAMGLDVLVHGEFERTDMVEYFGQQMDGFMSTENGWVQSYGSRCVKPPVLFGDVQRRGPMTVKWSQYAQTLTKKPMKGMLTGPVTIMQWSFVRDDQPRKDTCTQLALALRDEVVDLETAGIAMIQMDEPAIREGLPLRRAEWNAYLSWAVECFRLSVCGAKDETQIHTHMCYSEFGDIFQSIADMDADVLSIETSRSNMELMEDFAKHSYPNEVGPGVYDVHSARVPTKEEMVRLLDAAVKHVPPARLWANPDCGLKTRGWTEVEGALNNMVQAAHQARKAHVQASQRSA